MTRNQASQMWRDNIEPQLHAHFSNARPKLKVYEAHQRYEKARGVMLDGFATCPPSGEKADALCRATIEAATAGLKYLKSFEKKGGAL